MKANNRKSISNSIGSMVVFLIIIYQTKIKEIIPFLNNVFVFIGLAIFVGIITSILFESLLPKSKNKKTNSKKTTPKINITKNEKSSSSNRSKKEHNLLRSEKEILTLPLKELSWREFERLCYLYYKAKGYKARETSEGADGGVDLIIYNRHHQQDVAIQIKHYIESGKQVTVKEIRELDSAKKNHKCILAEFISSTGYTNAALTEADKRKIICHTVDKILRWREQEVKKRQMA